MTTAAAHPPVLLVVDPCPQAIDALETGLARRFGQDYQIVTAASSDAELQTLGRLAMIGRSLSGEELAFRAWEQMLVFGAQFAFTEPARIQVVDAYGAQRQEGLVFENAQTGAREDVQAAAVFVLIGARPRTDWLRRVLEFVDRGFISHRADVVSERWPLHRPPYPFESSMPGVFAVGDVRHGAVKRVASAVGYGSIAIGSVQRYVAELEGAPTGLESLPQAASCVGVTAGATTCT